MKVLNKSDLKSLPESPKTAINQHYQ